MAAFSDFVLLEHRKSYQAQPLLLKSSRQPKSLPLKIVRKQKPKLLTRLRLSLLRSKRNLLINCWLAKLKTTLLYQRLWLIHSLTNYQLRRRLPLGSPNGPRPPKQFQRRATNENWQWKLKRRLSWLTISVAAQQSLLVRHRAI
jgi:hypothetical protein